MKWKTKTGKVMNVKDMTDSHLQNSINMVKREWNRGLAIIDSCCPPDDCSDGVYLSCQSENNHNELILDDLYATIQGLEKEQKRRNLFPNPTKNVQ